MSETQHYTGGCHCGAVRFDVSAPFDTAISCNCSICQKKGTLLAFVPADAFSLASGEEKLTDYQFNKRAIHHLFCSTCGVTSFARGTDPKGNSMVAINVRCLDGIALEDITIVNFDGRSR